jgi:peroxiredoxin Q/BCP
MYGRTFMGILRRTFLIDPEGRIAREFPKVSPKDHGAEILEALGELGKRP